jgi:hypothetical protein
MLPRMLPVSRGDKEWYLDAMRTASGGVAAGGEMPLRDLAM